MTAFTGDALSSYGGGLYDYSPVIDPTRDRPAAGANAGYAAAAGMTHTAVRAWVRMTLNGTATPVLVAHDAIWGNAVGVAPVLARTGVGVETITWPANVQDEIPVGVPGYTGPLPLNLRSGFGNARGATLFTVTVTMTSANVATVRIWNSSGAAADPGSATDVDVFVL
jgi:hypothetical protein